MVETEFVWVYVTCATREEALRVGRALVEGRLAACVNVTENMTSVYRWEGKLEEAQEAVLVAKTRRSLLEPLSAAVRELHSYTCPCVVALPVVAGNPAYLDWLREQTDAG